MLGGADASAGVGSIWQFVITSPGAWATNDKFFVNVSIPVSGLNYNFGAGPTTGLVPTFALTYDQKLNFLNGKSWFFSAIDQPTVLNDFNSAGNGLIDISNNFATPEDLMALAPYQGKMAVFGKNCTQIWTVSSRPEDYQVGQTLANTGTIAKLSVQALGELDIFYLDETGIRTLRSKDSTLNAYVDDIGSPIDSTVQDKIAEASAEERAAACGIVDPSTGRYWLFLKDTIYVLSQFRSSKITAFSTYLPSYQTTDLMRINQINAGTYAFGFGMVDDYTKEMSRTEEVSGGSFVVFVPCNYVFVYGINGLYLGSFAVTDGVKFRGSISVTGLTPAFTSNQTAFVPQKFLTRNKRVFARTSTGLIAYGGATGAVYDNAVQAWTTPFLDADSAEKSKFDDGINASMTGAWYVYASADYLSGNYEQVLAAQSNPTYDGGKIPFSSIGTHFGFKAVTNVASKAVFSAISLNFKL